MATAPFIATIFADKQQAFGKAHTQANVDLLLQLQQSREASMWFRDACHLVREVKCVVTRDQKRRESLQAFQI